MTSWERYAALQEELDALGEEDFAVLTEKQESEIETSGATNVIISIAVAVLFVIHTLLIFSEIEKNVRSSVESELSEAITEQLQINGLIE